MLVPTLFSTHYWGPIDLKEVSNALQEHAV